MRFNPKARLDTGRVKDAGQGRGGGGPGGGGMRIPIPAGVGGGGIGGVIIIVLFIVLTQCVGGGGGGLGGTLGQPLDSSRLTDSSRYAGCKTGADAEENPDCARVAVENSLYDYWSDTLGNDFRPEQALITFSGSVGTGCGGATSEVGPFYCPTDESIYLDTTFFDQVLEQQLDGPSGQFVEYYVLAHEYGHHIQNITGQMSRVRTQQGPQSDAVRLELQADCYAGLWTRSATQTEDVAGEVLITDLSDEDIDNAIEAAKAVGDDRIQQQTSGQVNEEVWTHGSAAQRVRWFRVGYDQGSVEACDTFAADRV